MIDFASINYTNFAKLFVVIIIITVATLNIPFAYNLFSSQAVKVVSLFAILFVLFYDIHLGLLLLTLFIIMLVQVHHKVIEESHIKVEAFKLLGGSHDNNAVNEVDCDYGAKLQEEASENIVDYILDEKVKPYEVFVKMMTNQDHLDKASNAAVLDGTHAGEDFIGPQ
jgi:hypothetical protein